MIGAAPNAEHDLDLGRGPLTVHLLGLTVCLAVAAVGYFSVWQPARQAKADCQQRLLGRQQSLASADQLLEQRRALQRELDAGRLQLESLRQRVPGEADEPSMLQLVYEAADRHAVSVRDYSPGRRTRSATASHFDVEVDCEGDFLQLCGFLAELAELPRLCRVASLSIDGGEDQRLAVQLTLHVFFDLAAAGEERMDG